MVVQFGVTSAEGSAAVWVYGHATHLHNVFFDPVIHAITTVTPYVGFVGGEFAALRAEHANKHKQARIDTFIYS